MRSLLKPLLAKEGLDLEHYLSMLTPLQGPAGITIDGQYLTHGRPPSKDSCVIPLVL
jgi:hypothetical protein